MLRRPAFTLLGLACATVSLVAAPLPDTVRLDERGELEEFTIARDEVHDGRKARTVPAQSNAEALRTMLRGGGGKEDLVLYPKGAEHTREQRRLLTRQVAVHVKAGVDVNALAASVGATVERPIRTGEGWYLLRTKDEPGSGLEAASYLRRQRGVINAQPQFAREKERRLTPNDPFLPDQWYIDNFGQSGGVIAADADVKAAWDVATGNGVTIGIVDDGLERVHPDLADHYRADLSFDFNYDDPDPMPAPFVGDFHGTACAGIAAGVGNNGNGIAGIAFNADLAGLRLIALPTTDVEEADAFQFKNDLIDIKSNSWGPFDNGKTLDGPGPLGIEALQDAVKNGRNGHGTIFVWAAGNGNQKGDNSNYDGFANRRETIAVTAFTNFDEPAPYAEGGANVVVAAPSSGGSLDIFTVDPRGNDGYNYDGLRFESQNRDYTNSFGGTSAACPLAAGVVALMLEARPALGWRDVQQILIDTAFKANPDDPAWITNTSGRHFHPRRGAGDIDAAAAVDAALSANLLDIDTSFALEDAVPQPIRDARAVPIPAVKTFNFSHAPLVVEHAVVTVTARHAARGQLEIRLTSPGGTTSVLAPVRKADRGDDYLAWSFTSVQFWGEMANAGNGMWTVEVFDRVKKTTGTLGRVKVELFGTSEHGHIHVADTNVTETTNGDTAPQPGEVVTMEITLRNDGSGSVNDLNATLLNTGGISNASADAQDYGKLIPSETHTESFTFQVNGALGETVVATFALKDGATDLGTISFPILLGRRGTTLVSTDGPVVENPIFPKVKGKADPYPANVTISGAQPGAVITKVRLYLNHLSAIRTDEMDVLLVAPNGKNVVVLSDAGDEGAEDVDLVFSDEAEAPLNQTRYFTSGTYRPTNFGAAVDVFPSPAPQGPHGANMSDLNGGSPNGFWFLFARDDGGRGFSAIGSWRVEVEYVY